MFWLSFVGNMAVRRESRLLGQNAPVCQFVGLRICLSASSFFTVSDPEDSIALSFPTQVGNTVLGFLE